MAGRRAASGEAGAQRSRRHRGATKAAAVVLVGLDSLQGLQVARILASHDVPVIGVAKDRDYYSCRTRVCESIVYTNTSAFDLIETLEDLAVDLDPKPVLIACQDKNVLVISEHRRRLESSYHVVLPDHDVVEMLIDKSRFAAYASEVGLKIPKTVVIKGRSGAVEAAKSLRYPAVIKPHYRSTQWSKHTKTKAIEVNGEEELLAACDHMEEWAETLIAQERVLGEDDANYTCNVYFDRDSTPLVSFVSRKIRQWPPGLGQGCSAEAVESEHVAEATISFFKTAALRGFGYLEMKRDSESGEFYAIEPNIGRPTGRSAIAEGGGVAFHYTAYCDAAGLPLPSDRTQRGTDVKWLHEFRDLQAALYYWRSGKLSIRAWLSSLRGRRVYAIFAWRDPAPFLAALKKALPVFLSPRERGEADYQATE